MLRETPDTAQGCIFATCLPSVPDVTRKILADVDTALSRNGLDAHRTNVQIALAEALNNIAEHAYCGLNFGMVALRIVDLKTQLQIHLTDWGSAMPNAEPPKTTAPNPDLLAEGGYGWFLIRTIMSDVRYTRQRHSNHLTLVLQL
ncbi:ATP-binding protein [Marivita sp. S0852]